MKRVNEYKFYELASVVHPLTELPPTVRYRDIWFPWTTARLTVWQIFTERPMTVALDSANKLANSITAIVPRDIMEAIDKIPSPEDRERDPDCDVVNSNETFTIREAAKRFEMVLSAEAQVLDTYFVDQKGSYRTSDLIEKAEIVFPQSIRSLLPTTTIVDIRQAGRCVALDTPTGAGFHLMRAIEGVMALYYSRILGAAMPTRMRNWGIYIKKLRDSGKADEKITGFLDHIRENYRNPITHPEVALTGDEAEILLGVAVSAIRQMVLEIQRISLEELRSQHVETSPTPPRATPPIGQPGS